MIGSNSLLNEVELTQIIADCVHKIGLAGCVHKNQQTEKFYKGISEVIGEPDKLN